MTTMGFNDQWICVYTTNWKTFKAAKIMYINSNFFIATRIQLFSSAVITVCDSIGMSNNSIHVRIVYTIIIIESQYLEYSKLLPITIPRDARLFRCQQLISFSPDCRRFACSSDNNWSIQKYNILPLNLNSSFVDVFSAIIGILEANKRTLFDEDDDKMFAWKIIAIARIATGNANWSQKPSNGIGIEVVNIQT